MVTTEAKSGSTTTASPTSVNATASTSTATSKTPATTTAPSATMLADEPVADIPQGLQVVKLTEEHTYILDEAALEQILLRDDVKDLPVVVISVAGAFRGGKSFLLNFFLKYLNAPESSRNQKGDWLGDETKPLTGFSWRGGSTRHTTGIVMWSDPIICNLPSGEKVALLLLDTQGTFDNRSSMRDCSTIFALSTLVSSVQIYNISGNIKEDYLQHLQFFTEYGRLLQKEGGEKAFQELLFLVRDWDYEYEFPFGRTGGGQVLENNLKIVEHQPKEMRDLRKHIRSCFETISCFLMPHPGRSIRKPLFDGRIYDLDPEFKTALLDLIPSIFSPEKLIPKLINGERVRACDLLTYFKSYMKIFNSDEIPAPKSIMKATSEAGMLLGVREARAQYESIMDQNCGPDQPSWPKTALKDIHNSAANGARNYFSSKKKMGSKKDSDAYLAQLNKDLETRLSEFLMMNEHKVDKAIAEGKEKFQAYVQAVHGEEMLCLHPLDLENVHKEAVLEAAAVFDSKRQQNLTVKDDERATFLESFNKELDALRSTNDVNNRLVVSEIITNYTTIMNNLCAKEPPLDENEFLEEHETALANAIETLDSKRTHISNYDEDPYKIEMSQKILQFYTQMSSINRSKNRKALQEALTFYENYMTAFWNPTTCCLHPADLKEAHDTAKRQALQLFHPNQDSNEHDYEKKLLSKIMDLKHIDLTGLNDSANEAAVTAAYNMYYSGMQNDTAPTGWWLLVIPIFVALAKKSEYHEQNKQAAIDLFYDKRRDKKNQTYDRFYEDLVEKIENAYDTEF